MSQSIGERLKSAREAKGTSLEDACRATKVQKAVLQAIEGNRLQEQIDPAYAKILLKKYASYLGLDGSAFAKEFISVYGPVPDRPIGPDTELTRKNKKPVPGQRFAAAIFIGIAAVAGAALAIYLVVGLVGRLSTGERRSARTRAVSARARETLSVEKAPAAPRLIVPKSQPLKLTIRTKLDVWMQVKADGTVIFQNVLAKGSQESWTAKEDLELWTGNAGAMTLTLNGRPLEGLGSGVKKGVRITHEGLKGAR